MLGLAVRVAVALALWSVLGSLGVLVQRRLTPRAAGADALLDALVFGAALGVGAVELLGYTGLLRLHWLTLLLVLGLLVASRRDPEWLASVAAQARSLQTAFASWPLRGLALASLVIVSRAISCVPLAWDALSYHLTYVAVWLQHGAFAPFAAGGVWEQYESFPKAGEALFFLGVAPLHNDALVGVVNLPFYLGLAGCFRSIARSVGASARVADLWALPLLLHPTFSAYVTPAYVEVQSAFYLMAALAAALRCARELEALPALLTAVSLGLATKMTALSWLGPLALWLLVLARDAGPRALLRALLRPACALGAVVALPFYLENGVRCHNPLYPAALPLATHGPEAGSLQMAWMLQSTSVLASGMLGQLLELLAAPPWRTRYTLGPGVLALLLPAAAVLQALASRKPRPKAAVLLLWPALFMVFIYLLSPHNGHYLDTNTRFLAPACAIFAASCVASHAASPAWLRRTWLVLAYLGTALALVRNDLLRLGTWAPLPTHSGTWAFASLGLAGLAYALRARALRSGAPLPRVVATAYALALSASLLLALEQRERGREVALSSGVELHPIIVDRSLWASAAALPEGALAFAVGGHHSIEGWFPYPLFGARLDRRVEYVDVEKADGRACLRRGRIREHPDEGAWLERIDARDIAYLLTSGAPIEERWARAHPERFRLLEARAQSALFAVTRTGAAVRAARGSLQRHAGFASIEAER